MTLRLLIAGLLALPAVATGSAVAVAKPAAATAAGVTVRDGYVAEAPPTAKVMAAFLTVHNEGAKPVTITAISSPEFARVEIHETRTEQGMARMVALRTLTVPVKASVDLKPGGKHVMLFSPKRALKAGDNVTLTFRFDQGLPAQTVSLPVRAGGAGHHGHDGHGHGGPDHPDGHDHGHH